MSVWSAPRRCPRRCNSRRNYRRRSRGMKTRCAYDAHRVFRRDSRTSRPSRLAGACSTRGRCPLWRSRTLRLFVGLRLLAALLIGCGSLCRVGGLRRPALACLRRLFLLGLFLLGLFLLGLFLLNLFLLSLLLLGLFLLGLLLLGLFEARLLGLIVLGLHLRCMFLLRALLLDALALDAL